MREFYVCADGAQLHVEQAGDGPPVVLAHAGFLDARMWATDRRALSREFQVACFDARGAGQSDAGSRPHSPADDLLAVLDGIGADRAHVVGLSMGSRSALTIAATHPDRVQSLVLASPGLPEFATGDFAGCLPAFLGALAALDRDGAAEAFLRLWFDAIRPRQDGRARRATGELLDLSFVHAVAHQKWCTLADLGDLDD